MASGVAIRKLSISFVTIFTLLIILMIGGMKNEVYAAVVNENVKGKSVVRNLGNGSDGAGWDNPHHTWGAQFKYTIDVKGEEKYGYCFNSHKDFDSGYSYTAKYPGNTSTWTNLSEQRQRILRLVMFYGYNNGKEAPYGNKNDYYAATQVLVWEAADGDITLSSNGKWSKTSNNHDDLISGRTNAVKCYDWIKSQISAHVKGASFTAKAKSDAKTYTMNYSYKTGKWSIALTDSKKGNYLKRHSYTSDSLSMTRSGYKYTFSTKKAGTKTAVLENNESDGTSQKLMIFKPSNSGMQPIIFGSNDITKFYAKFKTEAKGKVVIKKKTSDGSSPKGFQFLVRNKVNGYSNVHTTDANGELILNVFPGTYTITEKLTDEQKAKGFNAPVCTKVTVKEGIVKTINLTNKRAEGSYKIVKTSDNGVVEGFRFSITNINTGEIVAEKDTGSDGMIEGNMYPGKYIIEELLTKKQIEQGYEVPEKQTITIKPNQMSTARFHNTYSPPKGNLTIYKTTTDGGKLGGFNFKVEGKLYGKKITEMEILNKAKPDAVLEGFNSGNWSVNGDDLKKLNDAIERGDCGIYDMKLMSPAISELGNEAIEIAINIKVNLVAVNGKESEPLEQKKLIEQGSVSYNNFDLASSAVSYNFTGMTNEKGKLEADGIRSGVFKITEMLTDKQKERYEEPEPQTVELLENNEIGIVSFVNKAKDTVVELQKTCSDGNIEGIEFNIEGKTKWGELIGPYKRATDRNSKISMTLPPGEYIITETGADAQKYIEQKPQKITITGDENEPVKVNFENIPHTIILTKTEILEDGSAADTPVEGAVYEVYTLEEHDGEQVKVFHGEYTTDSRGQITVTGIAPGKYLISEIYAPNGYDLKEEPLEIEITEKDAKVEVSDTNQRLYGSVNIDKIDNQGNPVEDTVFGLFEDAACNKLIKSYMTDETGRVNIKNLKWGTYYLKETASARGYVRNDEVREIVIGKDGVIEAEYSIINEQKKGSVELIKTDESEQYRLQGAVFSLYKTDGSLVSEDHTTNDEGKLIVENLDWGSYYFMETKAPEGYALNSSPIRFSVNATTAGLKQEITAINKIEKSTIVITKKIDAQHFHIDHGIPSFTFTLTGTDINGEEKQYSAMATFSKEYVENNIDDEGNVSADVIFSDLTAGSYTCEEQEVLRYKLEDILNVSENGTVDDEGKSVTFILQGKDSGYATFSNIKGDESDYSDTTTVTNIFKKNKRLTALAVEYIGPDVLEGNMPFDALENLEVTAFYDDGSESSLSYGEYLLFNGDNTEFTRTSKAAGTYTVTAQYTEGGVTKRGDFSFDVEAAKKLIVTFETNGGTSLASLSVWKYDCLNDYSKLKTTTEKLGYKFISWYEEKDLTSQFQYDDPIEKEITLYAGWEKLHLNDFSWKEIKKISDSGDAESLLGECFYAVKDDLADDGYISAENYKHMKQFTYKGNIYHAMIAGFSHDERSSGSSAGITFLVYEKVMTSRMNEDINNDRKGWSESDMRNIVLKEIFEGLSPDMKSVISEVKKTNAIIDNDNASVNLTVTNELLWLPSVNELYGSVNGVTAENGILKDKLYDSAEYGHLRNLLGEGSQYELFKNICPDGAAYSEVAHTRGFKYWTRSIGIDVQGANGEDSIFGFCYVNAGGGADMQ